MRVRHNVADNFPGAHFKVRYVLLCGCRNLEVLTLGRGVLNDGFFCALMECVSLQKLSITDAVLGSGGAQEIQLRHDSLRCLQIVKCRVLRIAIRFVQFFTVLWTSKYNFPLS